MTAVIVIADARVLLIALRSPTATADPAQASSAWVRWESVTKIFTDFALVSGLVAFVFAIVLAAATLLTLEHVKPFLLTRVR